MLDKYSEDAKKTHQDFESSKKDNASDTSKDEKSKESTNKASNPQLPTKKELEHKTTPAQSFEDDLSKIIRVQLVCSKHYLNLMVVT